jgi:hypothetical protein
MDDVDIKKAMKNMLPKKRIWLQYYFPDLRRDKRQMSIEEAAHKSGIKQTWAIEQWAQTAEFKSFAAIYLYSHQTEDLLAMYKAVKDKALKGDEKAVKLMLLLQKEIAAQSKEAIKFLKKKKGVESEDPYAELD